MAQEASGLPYYSQNPTGIGAIYLSGDVDLNQQQRDNLKITDDGFVRRRAEQLAKKQAAAKLVDGIDPNVEGIFDTDAPYIQQRLTELEGLRKNLLSSGADPSDPRFVEAYSAAKGLEKQIEAEVQASKGHKQMFVQAAKDYDPAKNDDMTLSNWDKFRGADLPTRMKMDTGKLLVPKKSGLLELTRKNLLDKAPLDVSTTIQKEPVTGGFQTVKTKTYTPARISGMATAGYRGNPEITEEVDLDYSRLDPNRQAAYIQQAEAESKQKGETVSAQEIFYRDFISGLAPIQQEGGNAFFTPSQRASATAKFGGEKEEDFVKYIAEAVGKAQSEDAEFWNEEGVNIEGEETITTTPTSYRADKPVVKFSNALNNLPLGRAPIPVYERDLDGAIVLDSNQKPIIKSYQSIPNRVLNMKKEDGKVYIQTDESLIQKEQGGDAKATGWIELNDRTIDKLVLGTSNPVKNAAALRRTLVSMKAYPNKNVKFGNTPSTTTVVKEKIDW